MNARQHKIATLTLRLEGWLCTALTEETLAYGSSQTTCNSSSGNPEHSSGLFEHCTEIHKPTLRYTHSYTQSKF